MAKNAQQKPAPRTKKTGKWRRFRIVGMIFGIVFMILFMVASVVAYEKLQKAEKLVPQLGSVIEELNNTPSVIKSADGVTLYSLQAEYRRSVTRSEIPQVVVNAILAAEDKRFYQHEGIDFQSIARIVLVAAKEGGDTHESGGGSTLSMQLAKRVFTGGKRTIDRKLDNMALAYAMERDRTKDEILTLYLNQVYFGERAYGICAAADVYFGKTLDQLTLSEAATLARCVRRPSDENPIRNLEVATKNRNLVLNTMLEEGWISRNEFQEAKAEPIKVAKRRPITVSGQKIHPYFVDYVINELAKKDIDISRGGYTVETTLNTKYQEIAEKGESKWLDRLKGYRVNQMAILVTDNNGRIISMVGGPDYDKSEFNMQWMGPGRQLGSAMKPFVYLTGLNRGIYSEGSSISSAPILKTGTRTYVKGGANKGYQSITSALAWSNNTVAARAIGEVGPQNVLDMCRKNLGFRRSNLMAVQSLALGSGEVYMTEVAEAYSVLQSHGERYPTYAIERVIEPDGSVIPLTPRRAASVVSSSAAEYIDLALRQVVMGGTGHFAQGVRNARGKTGTTSDHKDAWFCGYTDKLIGIVWCANEEMVDGRPKAVPMRGLFGGEGPARVWNDVMGDIQDAMGEKSRTFSRLEHVEPSEPGDEVIEPDKPAEDDTVTIPEQPTEEVTPVVKDPNATPVVTPPTNGGDGTADPAQGGGNRPGNNRPPTGNGDGREVVYVTVCADSLQRATAYCSETVRRPFFKGTEPRGSCPLHGPTTEHNEFAENHGFRGLLTNVSHPFSDRATGHHEVHGGSAGLAVLL